MTQVTLREYLQSIEDALTSEQVEDALSKCQYVQTQFPDALEVQRLLGETYLKQGMIQEAQLAFDWVLTNDPENVVVYCDRALISEQMNDYETALDCYQQAYELSRGNSAIRQQFNMLSSRTGQQGFMLSRAGLARLYMRGDLLSQASQEWEMVLNMTPERLDARTGLLETYWREGLDERVEQLAHQILRDIPECLKALLLLAHVTAPRDMQQARELIQRAEVLDPDLVMARELFADAIAAQPGHPFWKLVNKTPVVIEQVSSAKRVEQAIREPQRVPTPVEREREQVLVPDSLARPSSSISSDDWKVLEGWQPLENSPVMSHQPSPVDNLYAALIGREDIASNSFAQEPIEDRPTMEVQQHHVAQVQQGLPQDRASLTMRGAEPAQKADEQSFVSPQSNDWSSSIGEAQNTLSSTPEWLSMLTQDAQNEPRTQWEQSEQLATAQQPVEKTNLDTLSASSDPGIVEGAGTSGESEDAWRLALQTSLDQPGVSSDDEEESFFGPAWLKSLGAASMDVEPQSEQVAEPQLEETPISEPIQSGASEAVEITPEVNTSSTADATSAMSDPYEWIHSLAASATSSTLSEQEERNLLTTLEGLEQDLRRQGFIPLEPNTLSAIAQHQQVSEAKGPVSELDAAQSPLQESTHIHNEQPEQDVLLSSVLAQLGSYASTPQPAQITHPAQSSPSLEPIANEQQVSSESFGEPVLEQSSTMANGDAPLWIAALSNDSFPDAVQATAASSEDEFPEKAVASANSNTSIHQNDIPAQQLELPSQLSYSMPVEQPYQESAKTQQQFPVEASTVIGQPAAPIVPESTFVPPALPVPIPQRERQKPAASFNEVFSDDLEVTMKRPAVRLQPVQQAQKSQGTQKPSPVSPLPATSPGQRQGMGRMETRQPGRSDGGSSSTGGTGNQERLRRGYQHQLVGDYDEAMQEYRIIIRNAPELLGEVVSNVRALLKLAPKYSAGYRVLGDAYMRQGEYLQAMDAYNQALAITKKARV